MLTRLFDEVDPTMPRSHGDVKSTVRRKGWLAIRLVRLSRKKRESVAPADLVPPIDLTPNSSPIYINKSKLSAITPMPTIRAYTGAWPWSYSLAAGNNSSMEMKTMIPATPANISPNTVSEKNGRRIR